MTFGIISEGILDQVVINHLLYGCYNDPDLFINPLHPKDRIDPYGWTKVFDYCKSEEFRDAFDFNDFIIIQIDTDTKDDWPDIKIPDANHREVESIKNQITEIINYFKLIIGANFFEAHKGKIIFAISVQSIECWILPFYATQEAHKSKIVNCLNTLNSYLKKLGYTIDPNRKGYEDSKYFEKACIPLKKKKEIDKHAGKNVSLKYFIESLPMLG